MNGEDVVPVFGSSGGPGDGLDGRKFEGRERKGEGGRLFGESAWVKRDRW